jgi:hypothetical protein
MSFHDYDHRHLGEAIVCNVKGSKLENLKMMCICLSLSLRVMHVFKKFPSSLRFLLAVIPKWFSKSSVRREAYKDLYKVMRPDECQKSLLQKYSTTSLAGEKKGDLSYSCTLE